MLFTHCLKYVIHWTVRICLNNDFRNGFSGIISLHKVMDFPRTVMKLQDSFPKAYGIEGTIIQELLILILLPTFFV